MKKRKVITKPRYDNILRSTIVSKQVAYKNYKDSIKKCLDYTWIGDDGTLCIMAGYEEIAQESKKWYNDYERYTNELEYIKTHQDEYYHDGEDD